MRHLGARAILIYVGTMVLPVCVLVWLGLQSFQRQSEALRPPRSKTATRVLLDMRAESRR